MNILYVYADNPKAKNCSRWNCTIPAENINKLGKNHVGNAITIDEWVKNQENARKLSSEADIIVVERNFFGDTLTLMQYWKVRGKTILAIFDDAYNILTTDNPAYPFWIKNEMKRKKEDGTIETLHMYPPPLEQFSWGLHIAKAIQLPSRTLVEDWSKHNRAFHVNNFLDIDKYININPLLKFEENEIVIGWCGSLSHRTSFINSGILVALKRIGEKYPNVKILIGGDKGIFDMLDVKNKVFQRYVADEEWTSLLKSIHIGLAPLSGEYDHRRSWIKGLEYMALKIPWIGTNYRNYDEIKNYGILTDNGYNNWEKSLEMVISDYKYYKENAEKEAYEFALEQSSEKGLKRVTIPLYEKLLNEPYLY